MKSFLSYWRNRSDAFKAGPVDPVLLSFVRYADSRDFRCRDRVAARLLEAARYRLVLFDSCRSERCLELGLYCLR